VSRNRGSVKRARPDAATRVGKDPLLAKLLLEIVDVGLAASIFVVPMIMGGRQALGRFALTAISVAVALAWTMRQSLRGEVTWRRSPAEWLLLAGVVLLTLQLVPLPPAVLNCLAPHTSEILPLWSPDVDSSAALGVWPQVSLTPAATRAALVMFMAYGLLFWVTVQRIQRLEDVERILRWCALSALLMAGFGLVQLLTTNGKFYWAYEHPYAHTYGVAKGAFSNRNHFAHFLALGMGPLIWWAHQAFRGRSRRQTAGFAGRTGRSQTREMEISFRVIALGIVLFAVLLSLSRGGALATLLAVAVCLAVGYRTSSISPRFALGLGAVTLLIGLSLAISGHDRVSSRLDTLTAGSLDELDGPDARRTIWGAVVKAIPDYAVLGSGVGSHREVYPMYLERTDSPKYFSHAECGYLQVALESGMAGLTLLVGGIAVCGFWCIAGLRTATSTRMLVSMGAVSAGLAASAAHSFVDFVWYVPGCMVIVAVLAACACRLWQLAADPDTSTRRARRVVLPGQVGMVAVVVVAIIGTWMIKNRSGPILAESHWECYLMLQRDPEAPLPFGVAQLGGPRNEEEYRASLAAKEKAVAELEEVVRWEPDHARAHLRLAEAYLRLFHQKQETSQNVMSANQIRDAVIDSRRETVPPERRLDSRENLERWLAAAVGDHYRYLDFALAQAQEALGLCPLLGEGYLFLGELCFLEGGRTSAKSAYVSQALKVRPFDGTVLLHAGSEAILNGDFDQGLAHWQESFRRGAVYQEQIINWLVGRVHPLDLQEEIRFFLDTFDPDLQALRLLELRYRKIAQPEQITPLSYTYARAAAAAAGESKGQDAAGLWLEAMAQYGKLKVPADRLRCGRNALRSDPNSYRVREKLAHCLADLGEFAEAKEHLDWCLRRRPDHESLRKMEEVVSRQLQSQDRTASPRKSTRRLY